MRTLKIRYVRVFLMLILLATPASLLAQTQFVGKWHSEEIIEDTEHVIIEFLFKDSTNMEMAFITNNSIPDIGHCISRISVQGTYEVFGPLMFLEIENNTLLVEIQEFTLSGEMAKKVPQSMITTLKAQTQKQLEQSAESFFLPFDGCSMIYATHEGTEDVISFIIGDQNNAIDLVFTRQH